MSMRLPPAVVSNWLPTSDVRLAAAISTLLPAWTTPCPIRPTSPAVSVTMPASAWTLPLETTDRPPRAPAGPTVRDTSPAAAVACCTRRVPAVWVMAMPCVAEAVSTPAVGFDDRMNRLAASVPRVPFDAVSVTFAPLICVVGRPSASTIEPAAARVTSPAEEVMLPARKSPFFSVRVMPALTAASMWPPPRMSVIPRTLTSWPRSTPGASDRLMLPPATRPASVRCAEPSSPRNE